MDTQSYRGWYTKRTAIADAIVKARGQDGEADAEILLCCATGALAAQMWPGTGADKQRFVQFLIDYSDQNLCIRKISIPLLANKLEKSGDHDTANKVKRAFLPFMPLLLDGTVDKDEDTVQTAFPDLKRKWIRSCSYASSIYVDLRSGLVHEYELSFGLVPYTLSERTDIPSYVNLQDNLPDLASGAFIPGETRRYLHFPYQYIRNVMRSSAESAFDYWDKCTSWNRPVPDRWWTEA